MAATPSKDASSFDANSKDAKRLAKVEAACSAAETEAKTLKAKVAALEKEAK